MDIDAPGDSMFPSEHDLHELPAPAAGVNLDASRVAPAILGVAAATIWAIAGLLRLGTAYALALDLGFLQHHVWVLSQGSTDASYLNMAVFSDHLSPVLYAYVPLATSEFLPHAMIISQAVAFGMTVWLLGKVALSVIPKMSPAIMALLCLSPAVGYALMFDMHPSVLGMPILAGAFVVARRGEQQWLLVALVIGAAAMREDIALLVAIMVISYSMGKPNRSASNVVAWLVLLFSIFYSVVGRRLIAGDSPLPIEERYQWVGDFVSSPSLTSLEGVFTVHVWVTVAVVFFPFVFFPSALRTLPAVLAMGTSALAMIGEFVPGDSIYFHYHAVSVVLVACSLVLVREAEVEGESRRKYLIAVSLVFFSIMSPFSLIAPPNEIRNRWLPEIVSNMDRTEMWALAGQVELEASVATTNSLGPMFAQRDSIYFYPDPLSCDGLYTASRPTTFYPDYVALAFDEVGEEEARVITTLGYTLMMQKGNAALFRAPPVEAQQSVDC